MIPMAYVAGDMIKLRSYDRVRSELERMDDKTLRSLGLRRDQIDGFAKGIFSKKA